MVGGNDQESMPTTMPAESTPSSSRPLASEELRAVQEFEGQLAAIGTEWDQFHRDFDLWRSGLTTCHESAALEALGEFAADFNAVTRRARDLPRAEPTRELGDRLITAAEQEEEALRRLRDRWQTNNISLFESLEEKRSESAVAQRTVLDLTAELLDELEEATDPERLAEIEELYNALESISDDWGIFYYDYSSYLSESESLESKDVLSTLDQLVEQQAGVVGLIEGLSISDATKDMIRRLERAAAVEEASLANTLKTVALALAEKPGEGEETATPEAEPSRPAIEQLLKAPQTAFRASQIALDEVTLIIEGTLDGSAEEDLEDVKEFAGAHNRLIVSWSAFHERYNGWRRTEGGCDRVAVLRSLDEFNMRMKEIGLQVRDLAQSGYLLPIYNLVVEAAELEERSVRALRNTWQPFTVDAFIAVERERDNAAKLRREAGIALMELQSRQ